MSLLVSSRFSLEIFDMFIQTACEVGLNLSVQSQGSAALNIFKKLAFFKLDINH